MSGSISCGASVTSTTRTGEGELVLHAPGATRSARAHAPAWQEVRRLARPSTANVHGPRRGRRALGGSPRTIASSREGEGARWPLEPLGRRAPTDWRHYEKYPLTAATTPATPTPVAIGVNWYTDFDNPVKKGSRYWIGLDPKQLGSVRGGHCVCLEPGDQLDGNGRGHPAAAGQPELVGLLRPGQARAPASASDARA